MTMVGLGNSRSPANEQGSRYDAWHVSRLRDRGNSSLAQSPVQSQNVLNIGWGTAIFLARCFFLTTTVTSASPPSVANKDAPPRRTSTTYLSAARRHPLPPRKWFPRSANGFPQCMGNMQKTSKMQFRDARIVAVPSLWFCMDGNEDSKCFPRSAHGFQESFTN